MNRWGGESEEPDTAWMARQGQSRDARSTGHIRSLTTPSNFINTIPLAWVATASLTRLPTMTMRFWSM